jgi:hypothetical protein
MYLIVDSGSTKTDWFAIDEKGTILFSTQTLGLNPQVLSSAILKERIINNFDLFQNRNNVTKLFFYGAGCGIKSTISRIEKVFEEIFENCSFTIKEDTYAAVYASAAQGVPSIVETFLESNLLEDITLMKCPKNYRSYSNQNLIFLQILSKRIYTVEKILIPIWRVLQNL